MAASIPGMGAVPATTGGVAFRVWAKFARDVHVAGEFNGWSETATPLQPEGNGNWSTDVSVAQVGQRYRYVIIGSDGKQRWRTDPRALRVDSQELGDADGYVVAPKYFWDSGSFHMPSFNELVIYELHVATFHSAAALGTFDDLRDKLGHLQMLGVNAIELLPVFGHFGAHSLGYNPAYPFDIESNYGSNEEFRQFIRDAHTRGMAVIMDVVYNHFGPEELDESLRQLDGWSEDDNDGIYFYSGARKESGFGPRPDYGRPEVRDYIRDNIRLWLEQYHVDGFRFDSVICIRNARDHNDDPQSDIPEGWSLLQDLNQVIKAQPSAKLSIAEDLSDNSWIVKRGDGGAGFDAQWSSSFYSALREAVVATRDQDRNLCRVRDALQRSYSGDAFSKITFSESHDTTRADSGNGRLPEQISPGSPHDWYAKKRSTLAAGIVLTSPSLPMLFQGQELLSGGAWTRSTPIDWNLRNQFGGIYRMYQDLIALRRNLRGNTRGLCGQHLNVHHLNGADQVIAYHRWDWGGPGDDVVVIANFGAKRFDSYSLGFPRGGLWWCRFNGDAATYDGSFGNAGGTSTLAVRTDAEDPDGMSWRGTVGLGPYSMALFSQ